MKAENIQPAATAQDVLQTPVTRRALLGGVVGLAALSALRINSAAADDTTTAALCDVAGPGAVIDKATVEINGAKVEMTNIQCPVDMQAGESVAVSGDNLSTTSTTPEATTTSENGLGKQIAKPIAVPSEISGSMVRSISKNGNFDRFESGKWFLPAYDEAEADEDHDWRGIGPWYPIAYRNIDSNAGSLITHNQVGEVILKSHDGGKVEIGFMQLGAHQRDGAYDENQVKGDWAMQYTFKSVPEGTQFQVVDPDTGKELLWDDKSPVVYLPSDEGDASFAMPTTDVDQDVRVAFVLDIPATKAGEQAHEIKIERGPNNHPELKGENPLPITVVKPAVVEA